MSAQRSRFSQLSIERKNVMSRVVTFSRTGGADVLELHNAQLQTPSAGEVRVRIKAIGLNRAEVMYRSGDYALQPQFPSRIGVEAAGIVDALGAGVTRFKLGDRVSVLQTINPQVHGVYADYSVVPEGSLIASPPELTDEEAAALWHVFAMAWGPLVKDEPVGPQDTVLITAASSAVGLASIQVAKAQGARVIAVTRSSAKRQALLNAGADVVIASAEEDLPKRVAEITEGKGATVILDSVLGDLLAKLANAAAPGARIVLGGLLESAEVKLPIWPLLLKGLRLEGFVGFLAVEADPAVLARFEAFVREGVRAGKLRPQIDSRFPLDRIQDAHRAMEAGHQIGKIVVTTQAA
jgi:NADPH:quinone reductase-like Zn-dependent oxidoreductase